MSTSNSIRRLLFALSICQVFSAQGQSALPPIQNQTQSVNLLYVQSPDKTILRIKNSGTQILRACTVSSGDQKVEFQFYSPEEDGLAPGMTEDWPMPFSSMRNPIVVSAAIVGDGQSEGDPVAVADLRDLRKGRGLVLSRTAALLDSIADGAHTLSPNELASAISKIQASAETLEDGTTPNRKILEGMRSAKGELLRKLSDYEMQLRNGRDPSDVRAEVSFVAGLNRRRFAELNQEQASASKP